MSASGPVLEPPVQFSAPAHFDVYGEKPLLTILLTSCALLPNTPYHLVAMDPISSWPVGVLSLVCFEVPTPHSRLHRIPLLVISLVLLWFSLHAAPAAGAGLHSLLSGGVSGKPVPVSITVVGNVAADESGKVWPAIGPAGASAGSAEPTQAAASLLPLLAAGQAEALHRGDVLQLWSSSVMANSSSATRFRSSLSAAAAVVIVMAMLLLGLAPPAAVNARQRRRLHLSILLSVWVLLLLRPAAAAATTCSNVAPVCTKAAAPSPSSSHVDSRTLAGATATSTPASSKALTPQVTVQQPQPTTVASGAAGAAGTGAVRPVVASPAPAQAATAGRATDNNVAQVLNSPAVAAPSAPQASRPSSYAETLLAAMGARKESMFISRQTQQQVAPGDQDQDLPQRVMPTAQLPPPSPEMQAQLLNQLLAVLMAPPANTSQGRPPPSPPAALSPGPTWPTPPAPALVLPADGMLYLGNNQIRVGVDANRGGAVSLLSSPQLPGRWAGANLINTWDSGRLVQQSYYGCADGSCWSDRAWRFNPVQGGSWQNLPPKLLSYDVGSDFITISSIPRNWGGQQLMPDVRLTTRVTLLDHLVKMTLTMQYSGTAVHPPRHQELPAVFVDRKLAVLAIYTGDAPWTNQPVSLLLPQQVGQYYKPSEHWAAYIDAESGYGVGVYNPSASEVVAYRIGPDNSSSKSDCCYLAPLMTAAIQPNTELSCDVYLAVGRLDDMRQWFKSVTG